MRPHTRRYVSTKARKLISRLTQGTRIHAHARGARLQSLANSRSEMVYSAKTNKSKQKLVLSIHTTKDDGDGQKNTKTQRH